MKKLIIMLALMPLISNLSHADPSVSVNNSQRATDSDSREKAKETSRSISHSEKFGRSLDKSKSYSVDVNINGLLLREFTARYERVNDGGGKAGEYFFVCKPLMNLRTDFPVIDLTARIGKRETNVSGRIINTKGLWRGAITGKNNVMNGGVSMPFFDSGGKLTPQAADLEDRYIPRYAQCRITASYWIAEAGKRTSSQQVSSEEDIRDRIRYVFVQMDADDSMFDELRQQARDLWSQSNCAPFLSNFMNTKEYQMDCGIFSLDGKSITVENRETLSESSIDGRSYKIAVNAQESQSVAADDSESTDTRVSISERESDSRESSQESKKTAIMSKFKSTVPKE